MGRKKLFSRLMIGFATYGDVSGATAQPRNSAGQPLAVTQPAAVAAQAWAVVFHQPRLILHCAAVIAHAHRMILQAWRIIPWGWRSFFWPVESFYRLAESFHRPVGGGEYRGNDSMGVWNHSMTVFRRCAASPKTGFLTKNGQKPPFHPVLARFPAS